MRGHATQGRLTRLVGILLALVTPSVGAGAARAEFFNIKYGTDFGNPSSAYGGAGNQPGFWSNQPITTGVQPLRDLSGALTNVTIELSGIFYPFSFDNPALTGDERALMNSYVGLGFPGDSATLRIRGLAAGDYDLITYGWGSDNSTYRTGISPNGLPEQSVGGAWPGGQVLGITYAEHQVHLDTGQDLVVTGRTLSGFGSVNGLQIAPPAPAPEPGTLLLAGVGAGLLLLVRLRRPGAA
jgi:hypothetical protein